MTIEQRLDLLEETIRSEEFLQGKGLGNEVPFWIFDYPPEKELLMRSRIPKLKENLKMKSINILEIDLYELCLEIVTVKIPIERIIQFESNKGSDKLLEKLRLMLKPANIQRAIKKKSMILVMWVLFSSLV
nr:BREX protein BrxB domain-containing protein [Methanosalsum zhilinae]